MTQQELSQRPKWLDQKHPFYSATIARAEKCGVFFLGGEPVYRYLAQYHTEPDAMYKDRCRRAYYDNAVASPIITLRDYIIRHPSIERTIREGQGDAVETMAQRFLDDVNGIGTDINNFMGEALVWAIVQGVAYAWVEPPAPDFIADKPLTLREVRDSNLTPRLSLLKKENVLDWTLDPFGRLLSVKIRSIVNSRADVLQSNEDAQKEQYTVWWAGQNGAPAMWQKFDKDGAAIYEQPIPVDFVEIPIVPIYGLEVAPMQGFSLLRDIVDMAEAVLNIDSKRDDFLHFAATQTVWAPGTPESFSGFSWRNNILHTYPLDAPTAPSVMQTDMSPDVRLEQYKENMIRAIYRNFRLRLQEVGATAEGASGLSKREDWKVTNAALAGFAEQLEEAENMIHYFWQLWLHGDGETAEANQTTVVYPESFDIDDFNARLDTLEREMMLGFPDDYLLERRLAIMRSSPVWSSLTVEQQKGIEGAAREASDFRGAVEAYKAITDNTNQNKGEDEL